MAVHQQTQRTYAIAGDADEGNLAVVLLDANLQVVDTVDGGDLARDLAGHDGISLVIRGVAVDGDQVILLTTDHDEGSGLQLLDLDCQFLRTIVAGQLGIRDPRAFATSQGRVYLVDDDGDDDLASGKVLLVIDIQSGDILQRVGVNLYLKGEISAVLVDGDEIFIACYEGNKVVALRYAGSEA